MDDFVEQAYLRELKVQCMFALQAAEATSTYFEAWNNGRTKNPGEVAPDALNAWRREIFRNLHSFLTHSANISKLCWPVKERDQGKNDAARARAEHLKKLLEIADNNALSSRSVRNHLDHYDTWLDEWAAGLKGADVQTIFVDTIGPYNIRLISGPLVKDSDVERGRLRWFDPETIRLYFRGEFVDIGATISAIREVLEKLESKGA